MRIALVIVCGALLLLMGPLASLAQEPESQPVWEGDEVLDLFREEGEAIDALTSASPKIIAKPKWLELKGSAGLFGSFNLAAGALQAGQTDRRGLASLKTELSLKAELRLADSWRARLAGHAFYDFVYLLRGREDYTEEVLEAYQEEVELEEAYLLGRLSENLDLTLGRQIVVWGVADSLRVVDILNPLDMRSPGLMEIEDLRLPVAMTRLNYYRSPWNLAGLIVHEVRFDKTPPWGSEFYPADQPWPEEEKPGFGIDNQEYALALSGAFSGADLAFFAASVFADEAHFELTPAGLMLSHSRLFMAGLAADLVWSSWLFKAEAAYFYGLEFLASPDEKQSRLDLLLGLEYSGLAETTLALEAANRHLFEFDQVLKSSPEGPLKNDFQWAARASRDFLHDRLTLTFLFTAFDALAQGGALERFQMDYELSDQLWLTLGLVIYHSGDRAWTEKIGDCHRFFGQIRYSF